MYVFYKTTLGDLSVLADLKEEMEKGSKAKKKKSDEDAE